MPVLERRRHGRTTLNVDCPYRDWKVQCANGSPESRTVTLIGLVSTPKNASVTFTWATMSVWTELSWASRIFAVGPSVQVPVKSTAPQSPSLYGLEHPEVVKSTD